MSKSGQLRKMFVVKFGERRITVVYQFIKPNGYYLWFLDSDYRINKSVFLGLTYEEAAKTIKQMEEIDEDAESL